MKIDKLHSCVKSILSIFYGLTIYNGSPPLLFFGMSLNSTAKKTHPRVTTDQQTSKWEKWKTITHTIFSLYLVHNNKNGSV